MTLSLITLAALATAQEPAAQAGQSELRVLSRVAPEFPLQAAYAGHTGICRVDFHITAYGEPENICVRCTTTATVEADGTETVEAVLRSLALESAQAVTYWRYDTQSQPYEGASTQFEYSLRGGGTAELPAPPDETTPRLCVTE